jgi:hypothetical protein
MCRMHFHDTLIYVSCDSHLCYATNLSDNLSGFNTIIYRLSPLLHTLSYLHYTSSHTACNNAYHHTQSNMFLGLPDIPITE